MGEHSKSGHVHVNPSVGWSRFARVWVLVAMLLVALSCSEAGECGECQEEKCADLLRICERDADCACLARCVGEDGIPGTDACLRDCGLSRRPGDYVPLEECVAVACPDSDECSTPSDYAIPSTADPDGGTSVPGPDASTSVAGLGGGELQDCSFDADLRFNAEGAVLQLQSADESICVRVERRDNGPGSLANTEWTLLEMRVGRLGEVALVDDPSALCWYSSHHNFSDWAHAWTGSRHFDLKLHEDGHGGARTYELYAFEQGPIDANACAPLADGSDPIGGPIEGFPVNP